MTPSHDTQAVLAQSVQVPAVGVGARPREAPAFDGTGRTLGGHQPQIGLEVGRSSRQPSGKARPASELERRDGGSRPSTGSPRPLLLPQGDGASPARHAGDGRKEAGLPARAASDSDSEARPRGKRKLDGVSWAFGGGAAAAGKAGRRGRASSPPAPGTTISSSNGNSSGTRPLQPQSDSAGDDRPPSGTMTTTVDGGGGGGGSRRAGKSPSASHERSLGKDAPSVVGQSGDGGAGHGHVQAVAVASPRAVVPDAASPPDRRPRNLRQPGGGRASIPSGSLTDGGGGGGGGSAKRRHTSEGLFDGHAAADAAGSSPGPTRHEKSSVPLPPSKSSGLVGGRREEEAAAAATPPPRVAGRFRVGVAPSSSTPTPGGGADIATDARHPPPSRSKEPPLAGGDSLAASGSAVAAEGAGRSAARPPGSSPRGQQGPNPAPAAEAAAAGDVDVSRPTSPTEGEGEDAWHERTVTCRSGEKRSRARGRLGGEGAGGEGGGGEDVAMEGGCAKAIWVRSRCF